MYKIKTYQVDAFAEKLFTGNPAAVCLLEKWLSEKLMQSIAAENNLAETAFVVKGKNDYAIRWFTPTVEVDLCGHATLASAFILFEFVEKDKDVLIFHSLRSGELKVFKQKDKLFLDFPTDTLKKCENAEKIKEGIGILPMEVYKGKADYIAVLEKEEDVRNVKPDFSVIATLDARGLIITAKGDKVDFVSRFFGPQSGINEDPVTGSAHTSLTPLWAKKLNKKKMSAAQLSERGGLLDCRHKGSRCHIGGKAKLFLTGEIQL